MMKIEVWARNIEMSNNVKIIQIQLSRRLIILCCLFNNPYTANRICNVFLLYFKELNIGNFTLHAFKGSCCKRNLILCL